MKAWSYGEGLLRSDERQSVVGLCQQMERDIQMPTSSNFIVSNGSAEICNLILQLTWIQFKKFGHRYITAAGWRTCGRQNQACPGQVIEYAMRLWAKSGYAIDSKRAFSKPLIRRRFFALK